jgi:hypothetical protein
MSEGRYRARYVDSAVGINAIYPTGAAQAISGAGVVTLTEVVTNYTSGGAAEALTLADGEIGQIKTVNHAVDGGSGVLTPANFVDGTTVTFTAVSESWTGMFTTAGWSTLRIDGLSALPVIA